MLKADYYNVTMEFNKTTALNQKKVGKGLARDAGPCKHYICKRGWLSANHLKETMY